MSNTAEVRFEADTNAAVADVQRLEQEVAKLERKLAGGATEAQQRRRQERADLRAAKKAYKETRTEEEQYADSLEELNRIYASGKIDATTYNRRLAQMGDEFGKGDGKLKPFSGRMKEFGKLTVGAASGLVGLTGGAAIATTAITTLTTSLIRAREENERLLEQEGDTLVSLDESVTEILNQTNRDRFDPNDGATAIRGRILDAASDNKFDVRRAAQAVVAFESTGLSNSDTNGLLQAYIRGAQASNKKDINPEEIIKPIAAFLNATGQEKNAENFERTLIAGRGLFGQGFFEMEDLRQLTKSSAGLNNTGESATDIMAYFASLKESLGSGEVAATGLKNINATLAGDIQTNKAKRSVIEDTLGLNVADVDLAGETIEVALGRIAKAMAGLDEASKNAAVNTLFGRESQDAGLALMTAIRTGDLDIRRGLQKDTAGFATAVKNTQTGLAAGEQASRNADIQQDIVREAEAAQKRRVQQILARQQQAKTQTRSQEGVLGLVIDGVDRLVTDAEQFESEQPTLTPENVRQLKREVEADGGTFLEGVGYREAQATDLFYRPDAQQANAATEVAGGIDVIGHLREVVEVGNKTLEQMQRQTAMAEAEAARKQRDDLAPPAPPPPAASPAHPAVGGTL